jgi:hypothetical protein
MPGPAWTLSRQAETSLELAPQLQRAQRLRQTDSGSPERGTQTLKRLTRDVGRGLVEWGRSLREPEGENNRKWSHS